MQQAATVGHPLYVLYVDLSVFFPSMDRTALRMHELLAGVPEEVLDLAAAIFGRAEAAEEGAECRYDSAAGLGGTFKNGVGALMGCVMGQRREADLARDGQGRGEDGGSALSPPPVARAAGENRGGGNGTAGSIQKSGSRSRGEP